MRMITLSSKGQLTIPRQLREALGLTPGSHLQVSVDRHGDWCWCLLCTNQKSSSAIAPPSPAP
jgi:AbrB family looped-hinge helix DNA binding protein